MLDILQNQLPAWITGKTAKFRSPYLDGHPTSMIGYYNASSEAQKEAFRKERERVEYNEDSVEDALLLTTESDEEDKHWVILDLDFDCKLVPSSTDGQWHLYMEKKLTTAQMDKVVKVLSEVGILNEGINTLQWLKYKYMSFRLPWVTKGEDLSYNQQVGAPHGTVYETLTEAQVTPKKNKIKFDDLDALFGPGPGITPQPAKPRAPLGVYSNAALKTAMHRDSSNTW